MSLVVMSWALLLGHEWAVDGSSFLGLSATPKSVSGARVA